MARSSDKLPNRQVQPQTSEQPRFTGQDFGDGFTLVENFTEQEQKNAQRRADSRELGAAAGRRLNREAAGIDQALSNDIDQIINFSVVSARRSVSAIFVPAVNPSLDARLLGSFAGNVGDVCISGGVHLLSNGAYFVGGTAVVFAAGATYAEVRLTTNGQLRSLAQIAATAMPAVRDTAAQHVGRSLAGSVVQASISEIKPEDVRAFVSGVTTVIVDGDQGLISRIVGFTASAGTYLQGVDRPMASLLNLTQQAVANIPGQIAGSTSAQIVTLLNGAINRDVDSRMPVPPTAFENNVVYPVTNAVAAAYAGAATTSALNAALATGSVAALTSSAFLVPAAVTIGVAVVGAHTVNTMFRSHRPGLPAAPAAAAGPAGAAPGGPGGDGQDGNRPGAEQPRGQQGR